MPNKVLIIDDEWTIARALCARLGAHGFELNTASDGPSGLAAARTFKPDAILLDLRMPDMDGFEVLRRLRADAELTRIPVFILTANVQDSAQQEARALGAAGFFCKPYDHRLVISSLTNAMAGETGAWTGASR